MAASEAEAQRKAEATEHAAATLATHASNFPALADRAFSARPELVRTFTVGYHSGLGRLTASKVKLIYGGRRTVRGEQSDYARTQPCYGVDRSGQIYEVDIDSKGQGFTSTSPVGGYLRSVDETVENLLNHGYVPNGTDWIYWRK